MSITKVPDFIDVLLLIQRGLSVFRVALNPVLPVFNIFEHRVIQAIGAAVKPEHKAIFSEHIAKINFIQRDGGGRLVRMYCWKFPGYYSWSREKYVGPEKGIVKVVKFCLIFNSGEVVHGALISIDGVLCNMSFGDSLNLYKIDNLLEVRVKHSLMT